MSPCPHVSMPQCLHASMSACLLADIYGEHYTHVVCDKLLYISIYLFYFFYVRSISRLGPTL